MSKSEYQFDIIFKIKKEREYRGLGQNIIANWLHISTGMVGNIESIKFPHKYTLKQLEAICKHFDIPTYSLFISDTEIQSNQYDTLTLLINRITEYENK